jgi:hypothetical protein
MHTNSVGYKGVLQHSCKHGETTFNITLVCAMVLFVVPKNSPVLCIDTVN